jgi:hypothetical protein
MAIFMLFLQFFNISVTKIRLCENPINPYYKTQQFFLHFCCKSLRTGIPACTIGSYFSHCQQHCEPTGPFDYSIFRADARSYLIASDRPPYRWQTRQPSQKLTTILPCRDKTEFFIGIGGSTYEPTRNGRHRSRECT